MATKFIILSLFGLLTGLTGTGMGMLAIFILDITADSFGLDGKAVFKLRMGAAATATLIVIVVLRRLNRRIDFGEWMAEADQDQTPPEDRRDVATRAAGE